MRRQTTRALHAALLRWFAREGRDLPWRKTRDPYRIWVSEVMLQQTQVDRVVGFYRRFLKKFPTIRALARARWPEVLAAWRGLGYYGRARNMMRAARAVIAGSGGRLPATIAGLEALPGIGPYTARAIAVFSGEVHELVLDTNTCRVLSRFFGLGDKAAEFFERSAGAIVPKGKSWAFHQGLMDLGAMVCAAREPKCSACPLEKRCDFAERRDRTTPHPSLSPEGRGFKLISLSPGGERVRVRGKPRPPATDVAAAVIHRNGEILIATRPPACPAGERGPLARLWEFPGGKREPGDDWRSCLKRTIKKELGIEVAVRPHDWTADHASPDRTVHVRFHRCSILKGNPRPKDGQRIRWVKPQELERLRFPPADAQIISALSQARFVDPHAIPLTSR